LTPLRYAPGAQSSTERERVNVGLCAGKKKKNMQGIILNYNVSLKDIIRPIKNEVSELYWLTVLQSGPFNLQFSYTNPSLQKTIEDALLNFANIANTSMNVWKPNGLTEYTEFILIDEWSYFIGIKCNEDNIENIANEFNIPCYMNKEFFDKIKQYTEIFILYVDEWWEIYTDNKAWNKKILGHFKPLITDSNKWEDVE
jgi:hypothetical protein